MTWQEGDLGLPTCPPPCCLSWRCELGGLGARWGVTYAIWEVLNRLLLYFCITPWNRPRGVRAGGLSGAEEDLEDAEPE